MHKLQIFRVGLLFSLLLTDESGLKPTLVVVTHVNIYLQEKKGSYM